MNAKTIKRQPRGNPTGGRFAEKDHTPDTIELAEPEAKPRERVSGGLNEREILEQATLLSRVGAYRVGLSREDAEDIAQETVLSVLYTQERNGGIPIEGGLIRKASRALISRRIDSHSRHEDSKAFAMWKRQVEQREATEGRHLSSVELDQLAVDIRNNWHNPRHKPAVGFQHETKFVSSDAMGLAFAEVHPTVDPFEVEGAEELHDFVDKIEAGEVTRDDARRRLWNVLAGDADAPEALRSSVTESRARRYIKEIPDAFAAAMAFRDGTATEAEVTALFAPFGSCSDVEKKVIAKTITDRPKHGHLLWRSALDFSNARYAQ